MVVCYRPGARHACSWVVFEDPRYEAFRNMSKSSLMKKAKGLGIGKTDMDALLDAGSCHEDWVKKV